MKQVLALFVMIFFMNPMIATSVQLVSLTPDAEQTIAYIARVSNPANQENEEYAGLLRYCIKHHHWSVFEQATMTLEIETSRAILMQLTRHRSFTFQVFSQRYANNNLLGTIIPLPELRRQDVKNRQNSIDDLNAEEQAYWNKRIEELFENTMILYNDMIDAGIAKECARFILPEIMPTRIYMTGNIRSWIHYIELRTHPDTQKEHRDVAEQCKLVFIQKLPIISKALGWI